jgi:hypothetical protein
MKTDEIIVSRVKALEERVEGIRGAVQLLALEVVGQDRLTIKRPKKSFQDDHGRKVKQLEGDCAGAATNYESPC